MTFSSRTATFVKANKHKLTLLGIFGLGILFFTSIIFFVDRIPGSDDFAFLEQMKPYPTLFDWLNYRFHTWSGRYFAESFVYIFTPISITYWKVVEVALFALFSGYLFLFYRLFSQTRTKVKDYYMMVASLLLVFLFDTLCLITGMFWVTGAMNYFWLVTMGLVFLYPVVYYALKEKAPHWLITLVSLLAGIVATSSNEQTGLILSGVIALFIGYISWKRIKALPSKQFSLTSLFRTILPRYLIGFLVLAAASTLAGLLAPGNAARVGSETITWRPDFYTIPLGEHIEYASRWFVDSVVNQSGVLLILIWVLLVVLIAQRNKLTKLGYAVAAILAGASIVSLGSGIDALNPLVNFYATWQPDIPHYRPSLLVLAVWIAVIIVTVLAPLLAYPKQPKGFLISALILAYLCGVAIITLSPTMYASGPRTLFVPGIVLLFVALILLDTILTKYKKAAWIIVWLIACVAFAQYLKVLDYIISVT